MRKLRTAAWLALVGSGAAVTVSSAFSQPVPAGASGAPPNVSPSASPLLTPGSPPATGPGMLVTRFTFSGNASQAAPILEALVASHVGKTLTVEQLNEVADQVKRHYRDKGWFLAQAYIPAQTAEQGAVDIAVLEGRIGKLIVNVAADAPISSRYATQLVATCLREGQVITEADMARPQLLFGDVPRITAKTVIEPGSELGTANLLINIVRDQEAAVVSGTLELDNFGSRVSGSNRFSAELNVNNPYGLGDQLALRGFVSNTSGNDFGRIAYSIPSGPWGTRVGASAAHLDYLLSQEFTALQPNGVADIVSVNASHPLVRGRDDNLSAQIVAEKKKLTDRTATPVSAETSSMASLRLQLNGDARDVLMGVNIYSVSVMHGNFQIDDSTRQLQDQSSSGAHSAGAFNKLMYSYQRLQQLQPSLNALFSLSGQIADKNLHSSEKNSIGGASSVRAFRVGELVGDQGYSLSTELRYTLPQLKTDKIDVVTTLFYDYGHITLNHDNAALKNPVNTRSISGYGAGLNLAYGEHVALKLAIAWPVIGAAAPGAGRQISAQAIYSY